MTAIWDKNDVDVDLYVTDPTGDTSWYNNKVTANGSELDVDNTSGLGPEHWTLNYTDTVQFGGSYQIRLHYFADRMHGATNYIVTVLLNEGTLHESTRHYFGALLQSNSNNSDPGSLGPDWVGLATVSPVTP